MSRKCCLQNRGHRRWVAFFTTDLTLSTQQIIEFYGALWKTEAWLREIKQEIGSSKCQMRNAQAVTNHLNFSMMAAAVTWIYADRQGRSRTPPCRQGTNQLRLRRWARTHCRRRLDRGFSQALAGRAQIASKCFRLAPSTHGGVTLTQPAVGISGKLQVQYSNQSLRYCWISRSFPAMAL